MWSMLYIHTIPMNPPSLWGNSMCVVWSINNVEILFKIKDFLWNEKGEWNGFPHKRSPDDTLVHFGYLLNTFTRFEKLAIMSIPVVFGLTTLHSSRVNWQKESGGCSLSGFQKSLLMKHLSEAEGIDSLIVAALKLSYRTQLVCQDGHGYFWAISYQLRGPLA